MKQLVKFGSLTVLTLCVWQLAYAQNFTMIVLSWDPVPVAVQGYRVYRGDAPGATNLVLIGNIPATTANDTSVQPGRRYYYTVTAIGVDGTESPKSNEVFGEIPTGGGCERQR